MDDRRLTFIVVPQGDLETKTIEIPYRKLKLILLFLAALVLAMAVMAGLWWSFAAQAARVPQLERELATLEKEREKVDSLANVLAEVEAQYQRVRQMLGADAPAAGKQPLLPELPKKITHDENGDGVPDPAGPNAWPLTERGFVTQGLTKSSSPHPGIDIAVPMNSYVRASGPGVVKTAGEDSIYGKYIVIDHGGGVETIYGHAARLLVGQGTKVKRLRVIALSGSTGQSTAPHLHFEIRKGGQPVDPYKYVRQP